MVKKMLREMLITSVEGQECRIAIVNKGLLEELYVERVSSASRVGNVYKGRVTNVEPGIQAAFVDFGQGRNGFLHISDLHPKYFSKGAKAQSEAVGQKRSHWRRPPIQQCLRRGQEIVAQVTKAGIGTKGPTLTTYLSIPGRLLVMMPGMSRMGISRKIEDDESRTKARELLEGLKLPEDMGFIVRTAGLDQSKREFRRDYNYLMWLWKNISQRIEKSKAPAEIYQESDLVIRTIRDVYNKDIHRIVCDSEVVAGKVKDFLRMVMPRTKHTIEVYCGSEGLFHERGLEDELERIYSRRVEMPLGGSLVIDQTEALVAIDVNSGRYREHHDAETTALKINLEAAGEIARQLRLRDLGGVIVIDFIDVREDKNRRAIEKAFRDAVKPDRAKTRILRMSSFGIVEMTRQRVRPSLKQSVYRMCSHCEGTGLIKSEESQAIGVMRVLQRAVSCDDVAHVQITVTPGVEQYLVNEERRRITDLEVRTNKKVTIRGDDGFIGDQVRVVCTNSRGSEVTCEQQIVAGKKKSAPSGGESTAPAKAESSGGESSAPAKPESSGGESSAPAKPEPSGGESPAPAKPAAVDQQQAASEQPAVKKSRRRGRRGGKKHKKRKDQPAESQPAEE